MKASELRTMLNDMFYAGVDLDQYRITDNYGVAVSGIHVKVPEGRIVVVQRDRRLETRVDT